MLLLLPTDTCYGLAGEFTEQDYINIYRLKGRDFDKLLAILVEDFDDMGRYIEISDEQIEFLRDYAHPWSFLGKKKSDFVLPAWMDTEEYQMLSIRVASVCLESPPDKGGRGVLYLPYQKELTKKAQENRKNMNAPERRFWFDILENNSFSEYKFIRQKPILSYIVDFYCQELALVVEIDGDTHLEQGEYDDIRTKQLEQYGLTVLRFTNKDVMENTEGVMHQLYQWINKKKPTPLPPNQTPLSSTDTVGHLPLSGEQGGQLHFPLFLTSANLSGQPESTTLAEAQVSFPGATGYDGGVCDRPPSDIFSIGADGELQYLRRNY